MSVFQYTPPIQTQEVLSQGTDSPSAASAANLVLVSARKANTAKDSGSPQRGGDNVIAPEEPESADGIEQRQNFILYQRRLGLVAEQRRATEEVRRIVRTHIFPHCKFANNETCYEYVPERIATEPLRGCFFRAIKSEFENIGHDPRTWWLSMNKVVRITICKMRSSTSSMLKKVVEGTYKTAVECTFQVFRLTCYSSYCCFACLLLRTTESYRDSINPIPHENPTIMPELEDLKKLRGNRAGWQFFCDKLLCSALGKRRYNANIASKLVREFTSPCDMALIMLLLENSWDRWIETAKITADGSEVSETQLPKTLWTSGGTSGGKNVGWSPEAHERFNVLHRNEMNQRKGDPGNEAGKQVEREYLEEKRLATGKKRKRDSIARPPPVVCMMDECSALASV